MERPNGRKIVLRFNNAKQAIGDEAGLLSGVLETRLRLYDRFYEPTFTTEQNLENRPPGIDREHWRWFLDYRAEPETKSEEQGRIVGRGELWIKVHKKKDGSYINDEARAIGVFGKEKPGRVRGVGFGPTPSQLFGPNSHASGNGVQQEETQRKLLELQAELEGEKLKRKAMEDEAASDKKKMKAMESALIYLFQRQGEELPPEIAAGTGFVE
ncbi:hypothetical protein Ahy_B09g096812 isoform N [Arachis hypogaea]|uniref:Uncharacterized protein n=1 Tax=Arachis hypogaea TaxID=3818 RepID=A0A444XMC4_ARAHY|nr:hypothetical protein Ahy_B09g096812 isoform N [Arachis hypogaea]